MKRSRRSGSLPARLKDSPSFDGGTARFIIAVFGAAAPYAEPSVLAQIGEWARSVWRSIGFQRVRNWFPIVGVFVRVAESEPSYLATMLDEAESLAAMDGFTDNLHALQQAIKRAEGKHSALLTRMLAAAWCPDEVKDEIAALRGLR